MLINSIWMSQKIIYPSSFKSVHTVCFYSILVSVSYLLLKTSKFLPQNKLKQ